MDSTSQTKPCTFFSSGKKDINPPANGNATTADSRKNTNSNQLTLF